MVIELFLISQVAKHIFEHSITRILKNQTVLLVTHGLQFLEKCDKIAFMKNGTVSEFGTYQELMGDGKGDLLNMSNYDQSQIDLNSKNKQDGKQVGNENMIKRKRDKSISSMGKDHQYEDDTVVLKTNETNLFLLSFGNSLRIFIRTEPLFSEDIPI